MKQLANQKLQLLIIVVFLITNLVLSGLIIVRSFQAQTRGQQTIEYIKCIVLLRYDRPDIGITSSRHDVESALDDCAKSTTE